MLLTSWNSLFLPCLVKLIITNNDLYKLIDINLQIHNDFFYFCTAGYAMLEERDLPDDLVVEGAPYLGPPIEADHDHNC